MSNKVERVHVTPRDASGSMVYSTPGLCGIIQTRFGCLEPADSLYA